MRHRGLEPVGELVGGGLEERGVAEGCGDLVGHERVLDGVEEHDLLQRPVQLVAHVEGDVARERVLVLPVERGALGRPLQQFELAALDELLGLLPREHLIGAVVVAQRSQSETLAFTDSPCDFVLPLAAQQLYTACTE